VLELYDCFTIAVLLELEDLGFCGKGEGPALVGSGALGPGGQLPTNTHGGLLSGGHPGLAGGLLHVVEAVRQLQGRAGEAQVKGANVALAHGNGGVAGIHATLILAGEDAA
jgi:acetyl-CoA acetyltransferase